MEIMILVIWAIMAVIFKVVWNISLDTLFISLTIMLAAEYIEVVMKKNKK